MLAKLKIIVFLLAIIMCCNSTYASAKSSFSPFETMMMLPVPGPSPAAVTPTVLIQGVNACGSSNNGAVSVFTTGGATPYTYHWANSGTGSTNVSAHTTSSITGLAPGTYTVTVTENGGGTAVKSATITSTTVVVTPGHDTTICNGGSAQLSATGANLYSWSPAAGLNDSSIFNPIASPTVTTTYTVTGYTFTSNLVINGDFSAGNLGFTSGYTYIAPGGSLVPEGDYAVDVNAHLYHSSFWGHDHTTGSGKFMIVNGAPDPGTILWAQTVNNVVPNTKYYFTTWVSSLNTITNYANLAFSINGTLIGPVIASPVDTSHWIQFYAEWNSGSNTSANISIVNQNTIRSGNDFGLDDISFTTACPATSQVTVTVNPLPVASAGTNHNLCGTTDTLTATGAGVGGSYRWSTGANTQTIIVTPAATTPYSVTVTAATGCSSTNSVTVTKSAVALSASASKTDISTCFGATNGTATVTASNGTSPYTYLWSNGATTATISSLPAGTYTATVTDALGCKATASVAVGQPTLLVASVSSSTNINCNGGNNGAVNITVTGGTTNYTYLWSSGATTQNITGRTAGTYTVTVTDAKGCTDTARTILTEPATLVASVSSITNINCNGGNNGAVNVTVTGGTTNYGYLWSHGTTTQNISGVVSGTYTVTVTDAKGCTDTARGTITQPNTLIASVSSSTNVSCNGGNNGALNISVTGGTTNYGYLWSNGATTQNISGVAAGTYTVTVTDAKGCTDTARGTITEPATLVASVSGTTNISCNGGTNGSVNITVTGGTTNYTYLWSTGANTQNITGRPAGTYTVTVTDAKGCNDTAMATLTEPATLVASVISTTDISCNGGNNGAVNITVTGGTTNYTYLWSTGATTQNITGRAAGTYTVTVTDAKGCTDTARATLTQPNTLVASVSSSTNINCNGESNGAVNITVTGGTTNYNYLWSNGATTQNISGVAAGTYTVTVTDALGCTDTARTTLTQPNTLVATIASSTDISCNGGNNGAVNITVTGGTTNYSFMWSNGATTQNISGLIADTYSVTVTDAHGCVTTASKTLIEPSAPLSISADSVTNASCNGFTNGAIDITVAGGTFPYTYHWSNGASTQDISVLVAGTYAATITDAHGCILNASYNVSQPANPLSIADDSITNASCFGFNNGAIDITVAGGTAPYTYNWTGGANTQDIATLTAGTYSVTVTDANGCVLNASYTVGKPAAALTISNNNITNASCFGFNNGAIDITVAGGTAPYTYTWTGGATTQDLSTLIAGTYDVTVTDAHGCITNGSYTVGQPAAALSISADSVTNASCNGFTNGSIDITVAGGTSAYTYHWSNGASTQDISVLVAGTYDVTVTDAHGCVLNASYSVSQPTNPLSISADSVTNASCFGFSNGAIDITVAGGTTPYSYNWTGGAITQDIATLTAGTYSVTITDANGCVLNATYSVSQPTTLLSISADSVTNASCNGFSNGAIDITVTGGTAPYTYTWTGGATTQDISTLTAGTYSVTITDAHGCVLNASYSVSEPDAPLSISADSVTNASCNGFTNGAVEITVAGGTAPYTYHWSTGASTQDITAVTRGTYDVTVTDAHGCVLNASYTVGQPAGALTISNDTVTNASCFGFNNGAIDITVIDGTSPYTYHWNTGASTQDITTLTAGTYAVTVTDAHGCVANASYTVGQPAAPLSISADSVTNASCNGFNNGAIDITVAGGTAPYTYSWTGGATTQDISTLTAGTYGVTITDAHGCVLNASYSVSQPAAPLSIADDSVTNASCNGFSNGAIDITVAGGTSPYTYHWNTGASTQAISVLVAGTYDVTVTDAHGCILAASYTVGQPANPLSISDDTITNASCNGFSNGAIDITVAGGTSPYTYHWNTGASTQDISVLVAGTYDVTVTDAHGCILAASYTVGQPANPLSIPDDTITNASCNGFSNGAIDITVAGGTSPYTYHWNTGASTSGITTLVAGTYGVTVTDAHGCTLASSYTVGQPAAPLSISADSVTNASCFGFNNGAIDITVAGGTSPYTYQWSTGASTQDVAALNAGSYDVTITDAKGCTLTAIYSVGQPTYPLTIADDTITNASCNGFSNGAIDITPAGGTAPYTYHWSTGATASGITAVNSGTYNVTVTDAHGCTLAASYTVGQPAGSLQVTGDTVTNASCNGFTNGAIDITVSGGTTPYTYIWNTGAQTQDISGLAAGQYTVTISDAQGCGYTGTYNVGQPSAPLSISGDTVTNASCNGFSNGAIDITPAGGTAPYTYHWNTGASTSGITTLTAGTYNVTVTDAHGCTLAASYTVGQPAAPLSIADDTITNASCNGFSNGAIDITPAGGTAPYTYHWNTGASTSGITAVAAGTYNVTVTDAHGCTLAASYTVGQPQAPLTISDDSITNASCSGFNTGAVDITVTGGTAPYTYIWSNGALTQDISVLIAGTYNVTITDAHGCILTASYLVDQPAGSLQVTGDTITNASCFGFNNGAIDITVSGGTTPYVYIWSNGALTEDISNLLAGSYTVTIADGHGCGYTGTYTVGQPAAPLSIADDTITNASCNGFSNGAIDITPAGGTALYTYHWNTGASTSGITTLIAGTYGVTVTDAHGCTLATSYTVGQPANPLSVADDTISNASCNGFSNGEIDITPAGGTAPYTYHWNAGASTSGITALAAGTYNVTVTDAQGCSLTASYAVGQPQAPLSIADDTITNASCRGFNNGAIDITPAGGTAPYTYHWNTGASTSGITTLVAGTYNVTVTDAQGCSLIASYTVGQPAEAMSIIRDSITNVSCNGFSDGAVSIVVRGGTSPYTFLWNTGATTSGITALVAGTYDVTVTDAHSCTLAASFTVGQPAAPLSIADDTITNASCNGFSNGAIDITPAGGTAPYTYHWNTGASTSGITTLIAGTYDVTVTDAHGCTLAASYTVGQPQAPLSISDDTITNASCSGFSTGAIDITVIGGTAPYTYHWSNGASTQDLSVLIAGTYDVTITDAHGCSLTASYTVGQPAGSLQITGDTITNASCFGFSNAAIDITVSGGTTPYTYIWTTGAQTEDISGLTAGQYTVTISDANGCGYTGTYNVGQPQAPLSVASSSITDAACNGESSGAIEITIAGGTAPYTYLWSNGGTTDTISGLPAGSYSVTVTDAHGCVLNASFNVGQPTALSMASDSVTDALCFGSADGTITVDPIGGTAPYAYHCNNGATTRFVTGLPAGTYTITITDAHGCELVATYTVGQPQAALSIASDTITDASCVGANNGSIDITPTGGTAPYTYNWSTGAQTSGITVLNVGSYTVTVTDAHGCSLVDTFSVGQPAGSLTIASDSITDVTCFGLSNGSVGITVSGGTLPYTYNWSTGSTTNFTGNLAVGSYDVTVTDAHGCSIVTSYVIGQPASALQIASDTVTDALCFGSTDGAVSITVTGGTAPYTYHWSTGATTNAISGLAAGSYGVTVSDIFGCRVNGTFNVGQPQAALSIASDTITDALCNGASNGTITINPTGGTVPYTYAWSSGGTSNVEIGLVAGSYDVTVTDAHGCSLVSTFTVGQPANGLSIASDTITDATCVGMNNGAIDITVAGGTTPYSYHWSTGANTSGITGLNVGSYDVTVTDANGCTLGASFTVGQPAGALQISGDTITDVTCFGLTNGAIDLTVTGGTTPYTYIWSTGSQTSGISGVGAGTYDVTVTDAHGCSIVTSYTIAQPQGALQISADSVTDAACTGSLNGSIDITVTGGTTPYTYTWSNGGNTNVITGLPAGSYDVTVVDAHGCTLTATYSVSQPQSALTITSDTITNATCSGAGNGAIDITVAGGTPTYSYNWSTGAQTSGITGLNAGSYDVTVTDAHGCSVVASYTVGQPAGSLTISSDTITDASCNGASNGAIDITATGGTTPYTYHWSTGANTSGISGLDTGSYDVTVTDAHGCSLTATYNVGQPVGALQVAADSITNASCNGSINGSIELTVTGGTSPYTYNWSNGGNTNIISGLAAGSYDVTVTDAHGCSLTAIYSVSQPSAVLQITGDSITDATCSGVANGSIEITVIGGTAAYSYAWSGGGTSNIETGLAAGSYDVTVTDAHGCSLVASYTVGQPANGLTISADSITDITCFGNTNGAITITVTGGTAPYTYAWSTGGNTNTISGLGAGSYDVTVTDTRGCSITATYNIAQPQGALAIASDSIVNVGCMGAFTSSIYLNMSGGTAPYTYAWSTGSNASFITGITAGSYDVTITDAHGCSITNNYVTTEPQRLLIAVTRYNDVKCYSGTDGNVFTHASGGTPPYSYHWNIGIGSNTDSLTALTVGNYQITVTDANGCTNGTFQLIQQPTDSLKLAASVVHNVSCFNGSNGSITLTPFGGTAAYTETWANIPNNIPANLAAGTYAVTITDAHGCTTDSSFTITQPIEPLGLNATNIKDVSCHGGHNGELEVVMTGGTAPYSYAWSNGGTGSTVDNLQPATYTVTVTDAGGCIDTIKNLNVSQPAAINVAIATTDAHCNGQHTGTATVSCSNGTAPYSFLWGFTNDTSSTVNNLTAGAHGVTITDANGCKTDTFATVNEPTAIDVNPTVQNLTCYGDGAGSIQLSLSGGNPSYTCLWNDSITTTNRSGLQSGTYTVTITDIIGCSHTETFTLIQPDSIIVTQISNDTIIALGYSANLEANAIGAGGSFNYEWTPSQDLTDPHSQATVAKPAQTTVYLVTVTDQNGCMKTDSVRVRVDANLITVPDGFTPNGDGRNDVFQLITSPSVSVLEFKIFNRWGQLIGDFGSFGWDGTFNGKPQPMDTYVYQAIIRLPDGSHQPKSGDFILIR